MGKDKGAKGSRKVGKVSKGLRKAGDAASRAVQHPVISDLVAAALTAAAASLAQGKTGKKARREAAELGEEAMKEGAAIGQAVKRALLDAARSLLDEFEDRPAARKGGGDSGAAKRDKAKG